MTSSFNLLAIAVPVILGAGVILVMLVELLFAKPEASGKAGQDQTITQVSTLAVLLFAAVVCIATWGQGGLAFYHQVSGDGFSSFFTLIFLLVAFLITLASPSYLTRGGIHYGEYYALLLIATLGMTFMASGGDLLVIFLGLETMSVALYVLAGFHRNRRQSNEASLKYLLLGAFSTGFLLYGIAMVYGQIGSTSLTAFTNYLTSTADPFGGYMGIGLALLLIGLAFKMAAVPFHFWSPDVYEGAPTPVTAFMSAAPKAAAFAAALRIFYPVMADLPLPWNKVLWVLAVLTMTLGNLSALNQSSIKRMLAYSSIAHAGYLLVGFTAGNALGASGMLYYLFTYGFMNIGAFTLAFVVNRRGQGSYYLADYAGLGSRHPVTALLMSIFMLSLIGIPPLAGFFGKLYVFSGAVQAGYIWLVVIAVLNSALSVFYYLRVMVIMYMREDANLQPVESAPAVTYVVSACALLVILLGVYPGALLELARSAVAGLL